MVDILIYIHSAAIISLCQSLFHNAETLSFSGQAAAKPFGCRLNSDSKVKRFSFAGIHRAATRFCLANQTIGTVFWKLSRASKYPRTFSEQKIARTSLLTGTLLRAGESETLPARHQHGELLAQGAFSGISPRSEPSAGTPLYICCYKRCRLWRFSKCTRRCRVLSKYDHEHEYDGRLMPEDDDEDDWNQRREDDLHRLLLCFAAAPRLDTPQDGN